MDNWRVWKYVKRKCVFGLDEMKRKSLEEGKSTTGEGLEWGVLFGFGPGLTVETIMLHIVSLYLLPHA